MVFTAHLVHVLYGEKPIRRLESRGLRIPRENYFTNLSTVGNLGSAAFLFIMEELFNSGKLKKGQRLLVMVPESARFAYGFMHLTVV